MTRVAAPAKIGTMTFTGFPDAAFEFYEGLEADNSKAYWQDHKAIYETAVKGPLTTLLAELEPEFGQAKVFRPHRDVRFSADKSPYKTQQGAFLGTDVGVAGHYLAVDANGLLAGGGFRAHGTDQTKRMRARRSTPRPVPSSSTWSSTSARRASRSPASRWPPRRVDSPGTIPGSSCCVTRS